MQRFRTKVRSSKEQNYQAPLFINEDASVNRAAAMPENQIEGPSSISQKTINPAAITVEGRTFLPVSQFVP